MKKLLHIIATPRADESRTLKVSAEFLKAFQAQPPGWIIDELNLTGAQLPSLTVQRVNGKYALLSGRELQGEMKKSWDEVIRYIEQFLSADVYLISAPMWNFSIPYTLKHYIDVILQPKYLFRYTAAGPEGLVKNKKMTVITSRGGDYSGAMRPFDFAEPYLRAAFGFVGIKDITFINAQPMDMGQETQEKQIEIARKAARENANSILAGTAAQFSG
ncbi:MAG: NAD(P)H-dependent oxidoreductase [Candidatus Omnitrophica bacterium]|nr:NAD(P)H-dependent oxidoreductase [Candidatus Omnitrophota bacterium]